MIDTKHIESLIQRIEGLLQCGEQVLIAVDGNSAAGKTTLAAYLRSRYECNVFHMDDFFLQPFQRTEARLGEVGGNVDYERFAAEILKPLVKGEKFNYRPYDCQKQVLGEVVNVAPKRMNVVEGAYSMHPFFGEGYHLKVFVEINEEEQRRRIEKRNPQMIERFINEWIPKERAYFDAFGIKEKSDIVIVS